MDLGLPDGWRIEYSFLPAGILGLADFEEHTIRLHPNTHHIQERCTLAHEIVHAERGPAARRDREEYLVERIASTRLIEVTALAEALRTHRDLAGLAEVLEVDEGLLEVRVAGLGEQEIAFLEDVVKQSAF